MAPRDSWRYRAPLRLNGRMETRLLTGPFLRVWLATLGAFATFGMVVLALPLYVKDELGYGSVGVGLAMGAASLTSVVFSVVSGRLGDRHGRRPLLIAGGLVMLGCYLALALQPSLAGVVGIRLVAGAAEATFVVALYTSDDGHLAGGTPRRGGQPRDARVVPRPHVRPGPADLIRGSDRYPLVWLVTAGVGARPRPRSWPRSTRRDRRPRSRRREAGSRRAARSVQGCSSLLGLLGFGGFVAFGAIYARDLGIERPGLLFALFGGVISLVRFFGRRLPDALGAIRTLELSFVCLAAGLALIGAWRTTTGLHRRDGRVRRRPGDDVPVGGAARRAVDERGREERGRRERGRGRRRRARRRRADARQRSRSSRGYGGAFLVASAVALSGLAALWPMRICGENSGRGSDALTDDPLALDAETMRELGYRAVDMLVDWLTRSRDSAAAPGDAGGDGRAARRPAAGRAAGLRRGAAPARRATSCPS